MKSISYLILLALLSFSPFASAKIFYSKNEALELAFGKTAHVETLSLFPDEKQTAEIQQLAKAKLESGLFSFYVGRENGVITGYAAIESETVRTKPETVMIVLNAEGELTAVHLLAFHEPPEYQAPDTWFESLAHKTLTELEFNKGVDAVSGATLSVRSALTSVRKVLAVYQVMVQP